MSSCAAPSLIVCPICSPHYAQALPSSPGISPVCGVSEEAPGKEELGKGAVAAGMERQTHQGPSNMTFATAVGHTGAL